jgi:multidrug efflux pump subunit AcrA (membrane-fusion protein)
MIIGKRAVLILVLILTILVFSGCDRIKETYGKIANRGLTEMQGPVAPVFAVNTTNAVLGQIMDYLALSGDIIASSTVDTYSDTAGKVSRLYVSVGNNVKKGDLVAAVDPSRPGMEFVPNLVRAPVEGTIVALPAQLGMTVSQAVPLARIAGGTGLEIRLYVAERFISKISLNQPCEITLDAYPGEVFRGSVSEISPTLDAASRTMEIRVNVDNSSSRLKAGMFAKVRIITEQKEKIVKIPVSAVVSRFGEQYVFVVDSIQGSNPFARKRTILGGISIDGILEVLEGLSPDEEIVIRGQTLLEDGSGINIIERISPLSAN